MKSAMERSYPSKIGNTVKETFENMGGWFRPEKALEDLTILFCITGNEGGKWSASITHGRIIVSEGPAAKPNLTVQMSSHDWLDMVSGNLLSEWDKLTIRRDEWPSWGEAPEILLHRLGLFGKGFRLLEWIRNYSGDIYQLEFFTSKRGELDHTVFSQSVKNGDITIGITSAGGFQILRELSRPKYSKTASHFATLIALRWVLLLVIACAVPITYFMGWTWGAPAVAVGFGLWRSNREAPERYLKGVILDDAQFFKCGIEHDILHVHEYKGEFLAGKLEGCLFFVILGGGLLLAAILVLLEKSDTAINIAVGGTACLAFAYGALYEWFEWVT